MTGITAVVALGGLAFLLATMLAVANRTLYVYEDPRIDVVEDLLPHANCGACGVPGCRPFAEVLVAGGATPGACTVSTDDGRSAIARYLGVDVGAVDKRVARLACAGGSNVARGRALYAGLQTCGAAALVGGGGKGCSYGCLGLADCADACTFGAITMTPQGLPVVDEAACTACGDCVVACPKDLFSVHAASHRLWVACASHADGDEILEDCEVACTACGRCAADAPKIIAMEDGLPVVDYDRPHATTEPIQRCPTGAIVWLHADGRVEKGSAATRIVRQGPRAYAHT